MIGIVPDDFRTRIGYGFTPDVIMLRFVPGTILQAYARLKPRTSIGQLNAPSQLDPEEKKMEIEWTETALGDLDKGIARRVGDYRVRFHQDNDTMRILSVRNSAKTTAEAVLNTR